MVHPLNLKNGTIEFAERLVRHAGNCIRCAFTK
jgi:hypothetical protein